MKTSVASMIALAGALASATPIVNKPAAAKAPESRTSAGPLKPFYVERAFCGLRNKFGRSLDRRIGGLLEQDEFCLGTEFFCKQPEIVGEGGEFANEAQCLQSREKKQFFEPNTEKCIRSTALDTSASDELCKGTVAFCKFDDVKKNFGDDPDLCVASRALNNKTLKNSIKSENKEVTKDQDTKKEQGGASKDTKKEQDGASKDTKKEQGGASMPFLQPSPKDCSPNVDRFTGLEDEKCLGTAKFCEQFPGGDNAAQNRQALSVFESKDECLKAHKPDTKAPASKPKSEKTKQPKKETKDTGKNTAPGAKPEEKPKSTAPTTPAKKPEAPKAPTTPAKKPEAPKAPTTPAKKPEAPKAQPQDPDRLIFSDRK
ncbi:hypothetical protein AAL_04388 [Moelleriella libera RCEF 2490]|uniref:Uncharacterized protein n=1 Tax=Moelleriella libera RCEF 2490 TaxID=1081109 RepID=A0A162IM70_9HYPO|nr:hypothetical protein AAL_04388 [Moelleriella libera RCEF 2490]